MAIGKAGIDTKVEWGPDTLSGETGFDIVYGSLGDIRRSGGDFSLATLGCLDDNRTTTSLLASETPPVVDGFWILVRGQNCGGNGTYDTGQGSQSGMRDAEISGSGNDCL